MLSVATDKKDYRSAFLIIFCTQRTGLESEKPDQEAKILSEYYYTQTAIRNRGFWSAAIGIYRTVSNRSFRCSIVNLL